MTTTPPEAPHGPAADGPGRPDQGPRTTRDEVRDLGRLRRSVTDRKVAGVAGGLARHLDIDPVILRVLFVVLVFFGGAGLILYGACWLLVPEEDRETAPLGLDERSRSIALIIVGVIAALALVGDSWGAFGFPWPLAVIGLAVLLFVTRKDRSSAPRAAAGGVPGSPATYAAPADAPTYPAQTYPAAEYGAPTYAADTYPAQTDAPPQASYGPPVYQPLPPVRVRNPRKRGPILFWFTLALIALAEGVLGIADVAGVEVPDGGYPALAVAISGVMLLVGAFFGRAGGVILVGLVSTVALAGATAAGEWDGTTVRETPTTAVAVANGYDISGGELVVDLSNIRDVAGLDGRTIRLTADVGRIEVIVPTGIDTVARARVDGPGNIVLFGEEKGGIDVAMNRQHDGGTDVPTLVIDADLSVGQIEVHQ